MSSLLLDTHVLLSLIGASRKPIDRRAVGSWDTTDAVRTASVVSIWEIAIKYRLRKLTLSTPLADLPSVFAGMGIGILLIDHRHVLSEIDPEPATRDPFDRLLLAQCQVEGMRLVTVDRALAGHPLAWREV